MDYPSRIIMMGEQDATIVKQIQIRLNELGCGPMDVDGLFGKMTAGAVKAFQSRHCDLYGFPLVIDGKVGISTWLTLFGGWHSNRMAPSPLIMYVLDLAKREIGVREEPPGSNSGPEVNKYLASVGLGPGYAWCAAFVFWCFEQVTAKMNRENPLVKTAGCMEHWRRTGGEKIPAKDAVANPSLIGPGCIFIISRGSGQGHTGIVKGVQDGYIQTIEGNTNKDRSADGGGVFELTRKIVTINTGFIKYF